jgi:hypothetical protein
MASNLPSLGTCFYNGIEFPANVETTQFRCTPMYDSAGRTVTSSTFLLELKAIWASDGGTDFIMSIVVPALTQPASPLVYTGRGFSDVRINLGGDQDVNWGPKPRVVSLKPVGAGLSVEMVWQVEWNVPTCSDRVTVGFPMEFTYSLMWNIDREGYSTRTMKGKVVIPQTRLNRNSRVPYTSADVWREKIAPAKLPGFQRTQNYELSEDRRTLSFTITDEQLPPELPPEGCLDAEGEHSLSSDPGKTNNSWTGSLSASYRVAAGASVAPAVKAYFAILNNRVKLTRGAGDLKGPVTPLQFTMSDKFYGKTKTVSFRCSYRVVGKLSTLLKSGGLWQPLPKEATSTPDAYLTSLTRLGVNDPRGTASLVFSPGTDDAIVDLCRAGMPQSPKSRNLPPDNPINTLLDLAALFRLGGGGGGIEDIFPPPTTDKSWLKYDAAVTIDGDSGIVQAKVLPTKPLNSSDKYSFDAYGNRLPASNGKDPNPLSPSDGQGTGIQRRTSDTLYVRLHGEAMRVGFQIPVPTLQSINGVQPTLILGGREGRAFTQAIIGNTLYPIYWAKFNLLYVIDNPDALGGALPVPASPLNTDGP